ncbi:acyltransferase family protein [Bacillus licheniformis]|uniref:acyltransferase family protein n=1 Tax=Bacillus licheniformis TaxID=1402 RepID=UPI0021BD37F6|nr:acyltransferase family protein [Bacillus licheniformis]
MQKRIEWIDVSKGVGIILVVLGHTPTPDWLKTFIFAFHMPLFFFLSGLVYHDGNMTFTSFLLKKIKTLLLPYFIFSVLAYLFWVLVESILRSPAVRMSTRLYRLKGFFIRCLMTTC